MGRMLALPKAIQLKIKRLPYIFITAGVVMAGLCGAAGEAIAQAASDGKSVSYPVVQALPSRETMQLNAALAKLGRNPRDLNALADAGSAALAMGDIDAAQGFFRRADQISANNPRVKAGLASALVRKGDPFGAIPLFDAAERAGAKAGDLAADRGLAYDLVGDNAAAQRLYTMALASGDDSEVSRRLALSQAISGDRKSAEATLLPLLRLQDKAAWRTRAFALAILGRTDEAVRLAKTILPEKLATEMTPYLEYMPRLTPAQQAAAANLGNFPRASEIGRDDPRVAQYSSQVARSPGLASADAGLVPKGAALGTVASSSTSDATLRPSKQDIKNAERAKAAALKRADPPKRVAPPEPQPERKAGSVDEPELALAARTEAPRAAPVPAPRQPTPAPVPAPATVAPPAPAAKPASPAAQPGFDLARLPNSAASPSEAERVASVQAAGPEAERSLADIFADLGKPSTNPVPAAGAVDIRRIKPAEPKVAPPPAPKTVKPPPPSHPSRIWVQLGVGRNKAAMSFDWRRYTRKAPDAFRKVEPYVSRMGQTNRLLAGPFESEKAANAFLAALRKADIDGPYVWTSPAGQVVDTLPAK